MKTKNRLLQFSAVLAASFVIALPAHAADNPSTALSRSTQGSTQLSLQGSAAIVSGSVQGVIGVGRFVVLSVATVGEGSVVVVKAVGDGMAQVAAGSAEFSVRLTTAAVVAGGIVVGGTLIVVREALGWALKANDKLVGYVVNDDGAAMLRQKKLL